MADLRNIRDLFGALRVRDRDGESIRFETGPFRIAMSLKLIFVSADRFLAELGSHFRDCLG